MRIFALTLCIMTMVACTPTSQRLPEMRWNESLSLPNLPDGRPHPGLAGPVAGIHNGALLIAGGANFPGAMPWEGGTKQYGIEGYIFRKNDSGKWNLTPGIFQLPDTVAYPAVTSTTMGIVYAGGETKNGFTQKVWLLSYDEKTDTTLTTPLPDLPFAITNASMTSAGGTVYLAGGESSMGVSNKVFSLNLADVQTGWEALPDLPQPASHGVLTCLNRDSNPTLYFTGGRRKMENGISTNYNSHWLLNNGGQTWSEAANLPYGLSAASGISIGENFILIFSGDKGEVFGKVEQLIADISKETDPIKKDSLNQEKAAIQSSHPGFSREVLLYNSKNNSWTSLDRLGFEGPVTTTALLWQDEIFLPSGEIKAGVRSPFIRVGKISLP